MHVLAVVSEWFRYAGIAAGVLTCVIRMFWPEPEQRRRR